MNALNELLKARRSVYALNKQLPVSEDEVVSLITDATKLVPDAFNMRSQRVIVALGQWHNRVWETIYDVFGGKVPHEKIESFKAGAGTILFFYDESVVDKTKSQFPTYADKFSLWAQQSNGMLQFVVWAGLASLQVGASLQHYNPVIDDAIRDLFGLPETCVLVAQMPFGGIAEQPAPKAGEDIARRVSIMR